MRQVLKTVSRENCGRYFLRNTSRIVKKTLTLIMLVCNHGDYPFEELRFCIFYANEKQQKKTDRGYVRAKYRGPLLDLCDRPLQNPSTIIPQYVR